MRVPATDAAHPIGKRPSKEAIMGSTIVNLSRIAIALTVLFPGSIREAMAWPDRTVRIITPTGAGGGSDAIARTMADALAKRWKQSVAVENKPGADGIIA